MVQIIRKIACTFYILFHVMAKNLLGYILGKCYVLLVCTSLMLLLGVHNQIQQTPCTTQSYLGCRSGPNNRTIWSKSFWSSIWLLLHSKFIYSEKATKFCEISTLLLTVLYSKVRWIFRKILWPNQNIWTLSSSYKYFYWWLTLEQTSSWSNHTSFSSN